MNVCSDIKRDVGKGGGSGGLISTPVIHVVLVAACPCEAKLCRQSDVLKCDVQTPPVRHTVV